MLWVPRSGFKWLLLVPAYYVPSIRAKWLIGEIQIPISKVMPWLGDASQKVMGLNPRSSKKNLLAKSLEQNLVGSKIKRPFRKSFWVKKTSRARFCGLQGRSRPDEELGFEWPGLVPAPLQLSSEAPMDQKGEIKLLLIFEKASKMDLWCFRENPI